MLWLPFKSIEVGWSNVLIVQNKLSQQRPSLTLLAITIWIFIYDTYTQIYMDIYIYIIRNEYQIHLNLCFFIFALV